MRNLSDSQADERPLVARFLKAGDEASFRALYRAHTPALLLLAQRLVGRSREDAEEAVQEAWVRALRGLESFRWESSLRTWLGGITINCCRELLRRRAPSLPPEAAEALEELPSPPAVPTLDVEALLRALPGGYREVLVLHDLEGYTHEEIGQRLGISAGTSKSQLSRARRTLRAWLDARERRNND